jgi:hypothetical protein
MPAPEWEYTNGNEHNRYDVVFLINGVPILMAETKVAHNADGRGRQADSAVSRRDARVDFIDEYLRLARLYEVLRAAYTPKAYVDHGLMNKTCELVHKHVEATDPTGPRTLLSDTANAQSTRHVQRLDEGSYMGTSPDVPGLVAEGPSLIEVAEIARDVAARLPSRASTTAIRCRRCCSDFSDKKKNSLTTALRSNQPQCRLAGRLF